MDNLEIDNITVRKTTRSYSMDNILNTNVSSNSTLLDTTMMSLPNNSLNDSDTITNYKDTIKRLTMELESAHLEIDHLNSENFRLKMDIGNYQKVIESYKKVTLMETKSFSPRSARKKQILRTSCFSTPTKLSLPPPMTNDQPEIAVTTQTPSDVGDVSFDTAGSVCSLEGTPINHNDRGKEKDFIKFKESSNKETQTYNSNTQTPIQLKTRPQLTTPINNIEHVNKTLDGVKLSQDLRNLKPKSKLCILSNYNSKGVLSAIEDTFSEYFTYCHYVMNNATTKELIENIEDKLINFTFNDYCILFIGENEFKRQNNYIDVINTIKNSLKNVTHTNKIICVPTYIKGALIYNYKIEMFNNLLCLDLQNNDYAHFFDSNQTLSHEMFSYRTGKINNNGFKHIYNEVLNNMMTINSQSSIRLDNKSNDKVTFSTSEKNASTNSLFRL